MPAVGVDDEVDDDDETPADVVFVGNLAARKRVRARACIRAEFSEPEFSTSSNNVRIVLSAIDSKIFVVVGAGSAVVAVVDSCVAFAAAADAV